jgi:hypothetical protein
MGNCHAELTERPGGLEVVLVSEIAFLTDNTAGNCKSFLGVRLSVKPFKI